MVLALQHEEAQKGCYGQEITKENRSPRITTSMVPINYFHIIDSMLITVNYATYCNITYVEMP